MGRDHNSGPCGAPRRVETRPDESLSRAPLEAHWDASSASGESMHVPVRLIATVGVLAIAACSREKVAATPLTYDGATSIGRHVLAEAIPAFEKKSGIAFGRVGESGGGQGLQRLFAGEV